MTVPVEIRALEPGALVELFELDMTALGGTVVRFHSGKNQVIGNVVWQGDTYTAFPVEATGFEISGAGQIPRPHLKCANVLQTMTAFLLDYNDMLGAKVTRRRTLMKYLDQVNWVADSGTAQAGGNATLTLRASGPSALNDYYNGHMLRLMTGSGSVQEQVISDYNGTTKVATVPLNWLATYLRVTASTAFASTPDSVANSITGDIDVRVKVSLDDWTPGTNDEFIFKGASTPNFSWTFRATSSGNLQFVWTQDGSTFLSETSTVIVGAADGTVKWVRVTLDVDNGSAQHVVKIGRAHV